MQPAAPARHLQYSTRIQTGVDPGGKEVRLSRCLIPSGQREVNKNLISILSLVKSVQLQPRLKPLEDVYGPSYVFCRHMVFIPCNSYRTQLEMPIRSRCSSQSAGGSTASSNNVMWSGKLSARMAATISGAKVVRFTIRLT